MNERVLTLLNHVASSCSECNLCSEGCLFLKELPFTPKQFALNMLEGKGCGDPDLCYSCNSCGWCRETCPDRIDLGLLFQTLKEDRIEKGESLPPDYRLLKENQDWVNSNRCTVLESSFETAEEKGKSIFLPGCTLCGYSPFLVLNVYEYLIKRKRAGGIMLHCCGAPFEGVGDRNAFRKSLSDLGAQLEKIGASQIITACPTCHRALRTYFPGDFVTSVYEIFDKEGLPDTGAGGYENTEFFLFHPCATQNQKEMRTAVRNIMIKMGCRFKENDTEAAVQCCGMGGTVGVTNPLLALNVGYERARSITGEIVATYCAMCREALSHHIAAVHILDLFFNPEWIKKKDAPPLDESQGRENFLSLKTHLEEHRTA